MKKGLCLAALLAAVGILARLPHPARDVAGLIPVRTVYLYMDEGNITIETDTGDSGTGRSLTGAEADLRAGADGELFLETAQFLLLDPGVSITEALFDLLRPGCRVVYTGEKPDLKTVSDYLAAHTPALTLAKLRAGGIRGTEE